MSALTGARFVLALFVVFFHFGQSALTGAPGWARDFAGSGYTSVSMFFVLSGYLLAYNYLGGAATVQPFRFWSARVARIGPAYWFAILLSVPFWIYGALSHTGDIQVSSFIVSITCTQAWVVGSRAVWNFPAWSLSCECFFYILFPFLASPIVKMNRNGLRCAMAAFATLTLVVPLLYLVLNPDGISRELLSQRNLTNFTRDEHLIAIRRFLWNNGWYRFAVFNPISHLPTFLLGVSAGRYRRVFSVPRFSLPGAAAANASAAGILGILCLSGGVPHIILHNSVLALVFCVFIFFVNTLWKPVQQFLSLRLLLILGEASYALYILQMPISGWFDAAARHFLHEKNFDPDSSPFYVVCAFFVLLIGASVLVFLFVERPVGKWIRATVTKMVDRHSKAIGVGAAGVHS